MKEIWIYLELYFETYEFSNLGIFLDFSEFIFDFLMIKIIKKKTKKVVFLREIHVDATWHARPRGSATWTHAAPTRRDVIYLYLS